MMPLAHPQRSATGAMPLPGLGAWAAFALAVTFSLSLSSGRAFAQQGWSPTVATSPGAPIQEQPFAVFSGQVQPAVDPRFFPGPNRPAGAMRNPLPQGAWSPIVTGAIPTPAPQSNASQPSPVRPGGPGVGPSHGGAAPAARQTMAAGEPQTGTPGGEQQSEARPPAPPPPKLPGPLDALPPSATPAQQYCYNTTDSAQDARFAWQAKKIQEMEAELDKRSQQLEAKTQEYKRWLARRDEFSRKAQEKLVGFYAKMRPDAAALQLSSMDEETAAAVLTKLETKIASAIMGEMVPDSAAKIATIISGAAKIPPAAGAAPAATGPNGGEANAPTPTASETGDRAPDSPGAAQPPEQPKS